MASSHMWMWWGELKRSWERREGREEGEGGREGGREGRREGRERSCYNIGR